jgi:hypothetical protein
LEGDAVAEMYYYNGVLLPKIPDTGKFWGGNDYNFAFISRYRDDTFGYNGWTYNTLYYYGYFPYYKNEDAVFINGYSCFSTLNKEGTWTAPNLVRGAGYKLPMSQIVWANYDIKDDSGNIVFAASTPVSTESVRIHRNIMIQGWLIGKRLAAMRGQTQQVVDTARLGLATLGRMILGKE